MTRTKGPCRTLEEMLEALDEVVSQRLLDVKRRISAEGGDGACEHVTGIRLSFSKKKVLGIAVEGSTDTLFITRSRLRSTMRQPVVEATREAPWDMMVGRCLRFSWVCVNNLGYIDCIQLGFDEYHPTLSLISVAGRIREYVVTPAERMGGIEKDR